MCVFNKNMADGSQCTIIIHVDDILITAKNDELLEVAILEIESLLGEVTIHREKILNYLGMVFDFSISGEDKITMDGFIEDLFDELR